MFRMQMLFFPHSEEFLYDEWVVPTPPIKLIIFEYQN